MQTPAAQTEQQETDTEADEADVDTETEADEAAALPELSEDREAAGPTRPLPCRNCPRTGKWQRRTRIGLQTRLPC